MLCASLCHSFFVCLTHVNSLLCSGTVFTNLPGVRQPLQHMLLQKLCGFRALQAGSHNSESSILLWCKAWALPHHLQPCIAEGSHHLVFKAQNRSWGFFFLRVVPQAGNFVKMQQHLVLILGISHLSSFLWVRLKRSNDFRDRAGGSGWFTSQDDFHSLLWPPDVTEQDKREFPELMQYYLSLLM